jgi:hypothetical protein
LAPGFVSINQEGLVSTTPVLLIWVKLKHASPICGSEVGEPQLVQSPAPLEQAT